MRRDVPTPGSITATKMVPSGQYGTEERRNHAPAKTSNGSMSCERSTTGAVLRDAITPLIAATYGSRVPKSVSKAIVRRSPFTVRRTLHRPTANGQRRTYTRPVFPTTPPPPRRLLVFARLPELGKVKSRLAQSIGEAKALAVYEAMLRDLLASIGSSSEETEVEVMWAPSEAANGALLARAFGDAATAMQTGATLGDRLAMAFSERFYFHRTQKIIAIGVDDPRLARDTIDQTFSLLDSCEWVVGPAHDGGYYLLGCRAAAFDPEIFAGIAWGSEGVFAATLSKIRDWQSTVAILPQRYDIDVESDLRRYAGEGAEGKLSSLLRQWGFAA